MLKIADWLEAAVAKLRPAQARDAACAGFSQIGSSPSARHSEVDVSSIGGPSRAYPFERRLERLYLARSAEWRDRLALIDSPAPGIRRSLRHHELGHRVVVLATRLHELGVQPGDVVAVHIDRSGDLVAVIFAIWLAGAIYLPLDRAFPSDYLATLVAIAKPRLVITQADEAAGLGEAGLRRFDLATIDFDVRASVADPRDFPGVSPDEPALIMFTSGSTGRPKGVVHSQRQLINRLHWMWEAYPYTPQDVQGQRSPMNVMPSMWELLGGVLGGVPTAVAPERIVREPVALFGWYAEQNVSQLTLTPLLIKLLLDLKARGGRYPRQLRRVINGGPMSPALQQRFHEAFGGVQLLHDFGCTETNTYLHYAQPVVRDAADDEGGYLPIANTTIHLLDAQGRPVARGAEGEVHIDGACVALGYLDQPALSAERFIVGGLPGCRSEGRLFRTGEMAVMRANGTLRMTGRYDHQVKINGLRVELEHVELVLGDHPGVAQCAVIAHEASDLHTQLVAIWVASEGRHAGGSTNEEALRRYLAQRLPPHMVPNHFQQRTSLPLRPNGKLDRVRLRKDAREVAQPVPGFASAAGSAPVVGVELLREIAAGVLGVEVGRIDPRIEFAHQGFDSALLMSFAGAVSTRAGFEVQVASCFDYPSIVLLARHLERVRGSARVGEVLAPIARPVSAAVQDGIAIIGISLRVPGADDRHAFWRNLEQGVESVGPIPAGRWDAEAYYDADGAMPGKSNSKWGGFLHDIDQFEPLFFNLSPKEAAAMDPQQRLCLMASWQALEDAGYAPDAFGGRPIGVYVGAREPDYPVLARHEQMPANAASLLGGDMSLIAARISYFLNLDGPSMVVDTACSSSMTALHLACAGLRDGDAEMALAGGVCLTLDPAFYVASSKLGVFSPTGHCRAFDAAADGFVHGEGLGFVVLKPVAAALRDGDTVYAVIRGTAVNQDGRSNGITAPNGLAQTRLQTGLYRRLGINPGSIGYVEAHGTGTALGDVVEVQALTRSFEAAGVAPQSCAIGSVKPNIGHLTAASGIVGVIKAALCLHHGRLVPSINYRQPNPKIDFGRTPFYVNTEARPWPVPATNVRRAAVNSFGIGGTNGHCVIEEWTGARPAVTGRVRWFLAPVTARTVGALRERLRSLRMHLMQEHDLPLHAVAFTLTCGRSRFDHGYVFAFRDKAQFIAQLEAAAACGTAEDCWLLAPADGGRDLAPAQWEQGARRWREALEGEPASDDVRTLGRLIAAGFEPCWQEWFTPAERCRVPLPVYSFQTERCWFPLAERTTPALLSVEPIVEPVVEPVVEPIIASIAAPCVAPAMDDAALAPIQTAVLAVLAQEFGLAESEIEPDVALTRYGMDSVTAINLRFLLEARLGLDLSTQDIVGAETARDLAARALAAGSRPGAAHAARHEAPPVSREAAAGLHPRLIRDSAAFDTPFALTDLQTAYLVAKANPARVDPSGCHVYLEFEVQGLDIARLDKAWVRVAAAHPMLRAQVLPDGTQRIVSDRPLPGMTVTDHGADIDAAQRGIEQIRRELSHKLYLAGDWPLYEIRVTSMPAKTARVHVSMDSWIADAHSAEQIFAQWQACYADPEFAPAAPALRFRDFVHSMRMFRESEGYARGLAYWRDRLTDFPDGPALPWSGAMQQAPLDPCNRRRAVARLPAAVWSALQARFAQRRLSATAGLLTLFCEALRSWGHSERFGLVLTLQNRPPLHPEISRVVGPFTSTALFDADVVAGESVAERARRYGEQLMEALNHGYVSAVEAVRSLGADRPARNYPVVFTSLLAAGDANADDGWMRQALFSSAQTPGTALHCQVHESHGELAVTVDGVPSWFDDGFFDSLLTSLQGMLATAAGDEAMWEGASAAAGMPAWPVPDETVSAGRSVPMTLLQQGYLAERIRRPERASGYVFRAFLCQMADPVRWQHALDALLADHPMLRAYASARGTLESGDWVAAYAIPVTHAGEEVDLDAEARSMLADFVAERTWPAFRLRLVSRLDGSVLLLSVLDMAVFDGHSTWAFYAELIGRALGESGQRESTAWRSYLIARATRSRVAVHERYWQARWTSLPPGPRLPAALVLGPDETASPHATVRWTHTMAGAERLTAWATRQRVSLEAVLLAAYASVLPDDGEPFALGVVDYGLRGGAAEPLVGFGDASRFAWVHTQDCASTTMIACARVFDRQLARDRLHAMVDPFHALHAHLKAGYAAGHAPMQRAVIMTNCLDAPAMTWPGVTELAAASDTPGVSIDNMVRHCHQGLITSWVVRRDSVDLTEAERCFRRYAVLLDTLAADPAATLALSARSPANDERANRLAQLALWNDTARPYDREICLHTLFERRARAEPFAVAVLSDDEVLTYGELDTRVNRLAHYLQERGVGRGALVAVMLPRGNGFVITILAILKCGGAFIPLNIEDPQPRLMQVLEQARAGVVVATCEHAERFDDPPCRVLLLDADAEQIACRSDSFEPREPVRPDDLAYVMFTSGSTGTPKGVMVRHQPVVNLIEWAQREFNFTKADRLLFVNPLSFDLSIFDIFGMLAYGASIRIVSDADRPNALAVSGYLANEAITFWNSAPAYLQMVLPFLQGGLDRAPTLLQRLRLVFLSGDWIPLAMPDAVRAAAPRARIISLGGATEATVWSNYYPIGPIDPGWRSIPYGKPIQNARYYVLDERLMPAAVGEAGDLYIGGECLSDGYINDPEQTASSFVCDPFHERAGSLMYRTGDRARFFADGNIEFLGRVDHQVKLRGYRIELGEVDAALQACGLVHAAVVVRDDGGGPRLVGFAVSDAHTPVGELRDAARWEAIRRRLPAYMLPAQVFVLSSLPITENGKVDRRKLTQGKLAALGETDDGTAAALPIEAPPDATPLRESLALWLGRAATEILGLSAPAIGSDDNLGQLGFNSLHYTLLGARLAKELGVTMNPALFFRYVSIAEIRDYLLRERAADLARALAPAPSEPAALASTPMAASIPVAPESALDSALMMPGAIAIIGMSAVMPQARDLAAFWANLLAGYDSSSLIPPDRWDWRAVDGDPQGPGNFTDVHRAAFMDDVASFDAAFFSIAPREAALMDPRQRLLLESVWTCLEDAGLRPGDLRGAPVGLFIGATGDEYGALSLAPGREIDRFTLSGVSRTVLANRVSYLFDWHGPSEVVDTACSSSLVAVHHAVRALQHGDCTLAIAGGINVMIDPVPHICLDKIGMLAADGRCKTFDARADGYARGEGVGLVVLKPLADALRDGDPIHAVIRGTAVNHGGRATALSAPNPASQAQVIRSAIRAAGVDSGRIGYIEAHGTGTPLGDPIEIEALKEAFTGLQDEDGHSRPATGSVALSSVKPNVGHLEAAAGIAGLLKAVLCVKHGQLPLTLHLRQINPNIQLEGSPFYIVRQTQRWAERFDLQGKPVSRIAGISSFGFGGVNAHVVIEQRPAAAPRRAGPAAGERDGWWLPLSAQGEAQLQALAVRILDYVAAAGQVRLDDIAYTLQTGRGSLQERALLHVRTLDALRAALTALAEGRADPSVVWRGSVTGAPLRGSVMNGLPTGAATAAAQGLDAQAVVERWRQLGDAAWPIMPPAHTARRIALPSYPFARTRYWLPPLTGARASSHAASLLPPCSPDDTDSIDIAADATVIAAHALAGGAVLPAAVYLALVMRAVRASKDALVAFGDVLWMQPFTLAPNQRRTLRLAWDVNRQGLRRARFYSESDGSVRMEHCSVDLLPSSGTAPAAATIHAVRELPHVATHSECYAMFERGGIRLGQPYRSVQRLVFDAGSGEARLRIESGDDESRWLLAFDGVLQAIALHHQMVRADGAPSVPFHIRRMYVLGPLGDAEPAEFTVRFAVQETHAGTVTRLPRYDAELFDPTGRCIGRIAACTGKPLSSSPASRPPFQTVHHYVPRWEPLNSLTVDAPLEVSLKAPPKASPKTPLGGMLLSGGPAGVALATPAGWQSVRRAGSHTAVAALARSTVRSIDARAESDWAALLADEAAEAAPGLVVLDYTAWPAVPTDDATLFAPFDEAYALVRAAMRARPRRPLAVIAVLREQAGSIFAPAVQALGAFGRAVRSESPAIRLSALALTGASGGVDLGEIAARIVSGCAEARHPFNYRWDGEGARLLAEGLVPVPVPVPATTTGALPAGSVVVVSGGAGGIGRLMADFLMARGCRVALLGRTRAEAVADFARGAAPSVCRYYQADVTRPDQVARALDQVRRHWGPIRAVLHAAGSRADAMLLRKDSAAARAAIAAKMVGAIVLDEATRHDPLDHFIVFSSLASYLGPIGKTDYAYANAFLNGFAQSRNERMRMGRCHGRSYSVDWPLWREGGMRMDEKERDYIAQWYGMSELSTDTATRSLLAILSGEHDTVALAVGDKSRIDRAMHVASTA